MALRGHWVKTTGGHKVGLRLQRAGASALTIEPAKATGTWSIVPELTPQDVAQPVPGPALRGPGASGALAGLAKTNLGES
eukprot:11026030-Lingulodinium_polyedra.AAC.1